MKKSLQPELHITWPPVYKHPSLDTPIIGRAYPLLCTVPTLVELSAHGAPDLAVIVHSPRSRFAYNMAIRWARKHFYGDKRISEISISWLV